MIFITKINHFPVLYIIHFLYLCSSTYLPLDFQCPKVKDCVLVFIVTMGAT